MKIFVISILILVFSIHLVFQSVGNIDNVVLFGGELVVLLWLSYLFYKYFFSKTSIILTNQTVDTPVIVGEVIKEKVILKRVIILLPFSLLIPATFLGLSFLYQSDGWEFLGYLALLIVWGLVAIVMEIGCIILYSLKYSHKEIDTTSIPVNTVPIAGESLENNSNKILAPLQYVALDFIDRVILLFVFIFSVGYAGTFFKDFYEAPAFVLLAIPVGYLISAVLLQVKKFRAGFFIYLTSLVFSFIIAFMLAFSYGTYYVEDFDYTVAIPTFVWVLFSIFGCYSLKKYI